MISLQITDTIETIQETEEAQASFHLASQRNRLAHCFTVSSGLVTDTKYACFNHFKTKLIGNTKGA